MKQTVIMATSHRDLHNEVLTKQGLESSASQINSARALAVGSEHDPMIPPLGKVLRAHVEEMEDGEYKLVGEIEIFDKPTEIILPDGTRGLQVASERDNRPFIRQSVSAPETLEVRYDQLNFPSKQGLDSFLRSLGQIEEFRPQQRVRKAFLPIPELTILLKASVVTYFWHRVLRKTVDSLSDEVAEDITRFYRFIRAACLEYAKMAIPKDQDLTYLFVLCGSPTIELAARTRDVNLLTRAIDDKRIEEICERSYSLHKRLEATDIQFVLQEDGTWDLGFLLTSQGRVIGSKASFAKRATALKLTRPRELSLGLDDPEWDGS